MNAPDLSLAHSSDATGLRVEHLRKSYSKKLVIRDVSLALDQGPTARARPRHSTPSRASSTPRAGISESTGAT
jgi:lipopolysaccharide export system ATP-binding protein